MSIKGINSSINIYVSLQRQGATLEENIMIKCAPIIASDKFDYSILKVGGVADK